MIVPDPPVKAIETGIELPDSAKVQENTGTVVGVGNACLNTWKPGMRVLFSEYGGQEVRIGGQLYLMLPEKTVLAFGVTASGETMFVEGFGA